MITKSGILELVARRNELLEEEDVPSEVDIIQYNIVKSFKNNFRLYDVDFILEVLTQFGAAPCLVYDDNGMFAVSGQGFQPVVSGDQLIEGSLEVFVEKEMWKPSIREALKYYLSEY